MSVRYETLRFGTAGSPLSTLGTGRVSGVKRSVELGLECQELEFVHGVNMNADDAQGIKEVVKRSGIAITAHGPYYINLNAVEREKREASVTRILDTARACHAAGGRSITFHAGFYLKEDPEKVYTTIKDGLKGIVRTLKDESNPITVSPELTGKETQFGDLKELLRLAQDIEQLGVCIDFAHACARTNGAVNGKEHFDRMLRAVEDALGKEGLASMHIHASGINYTAKGERNHLPLREGTFRWQELLESLKGFKAKGSLVCESPLMEKDALLLQKTFRELP